MHSYNMHCTKTRGILPHLRDWKRNVFGAKNFLIFVSEIVCLRQYGTYLKQWRLRKRQRTRTISCWISLVTELSTVWTTLSTEVCTTIPFTYDIYVRSIQYSVSHYFAVAYPENSNFKWIKLMKKYLHRTIFLFNLITIAEMFNFYLNCLEAFT